MTGSSPSSFEFGPFRLDLSARALYRGGEFVPVTPKAFDTLALLVENAGRVVTKEKILQRVWPDAFVEEGSIANNVSMLRKVLNPHFEGDGPIATIARRGYRFTAPVQARSAVAPVMPAAPEVPAPVVPHTIPEVVLDDGGFNRRLAIAVVVLVVGGVVGGGLWMVGSMWRPPASGSSATAGSALSGPMRRSVAVLPMKNLSADVAQAWLATALSETISAELAGGNQFRVVSGENVVRMQQELAPPAGVGLTRKQLDDIGRDLACDLILSGNYLVVGGKIRVDVRLDEVATGEAIASASITDAADRFLDIVSQAGAELRAALGLGAPASNEAQAVRAAFAASPEALRLYFQGLEALRLRDGPKAREFFTAAIAADDHFALAHAAMSTTWRLLGYDARGVESAKRAMELSAPLSREDRLGVEAQFHEAAGSWARAIELYQQLWTLYPDNIEYGLKLGNAQWLGSQPKAAVATVDELRKRPERDSRDSRIDLLEATAADLLADYQRASAAAARAADKAVAGRARLLLARARIKQGIYASRVSRQDEALKFLVEAEALFREVNDVGGVADAVRWQGIAVMPSGDYRKAAATLERAYQVAAPLNYIRLATEIRIAQVDVLRLNGDVAGAVAMAESAVAAAREADNRSVEARALTALGAALRLQSQFGRAREAYRRAIEIADATGEVRQRNAAVNNSAVIDFLMGDLAAARGKFAAVLAADRKSGNNGGAAMRLSNLSRVLAAQGELAEAERMTMEECGLQEGLKATAGLAWCRTRLAQLQFNQGRRAEAEALAGKVTAADLGANINSPIYLARFAHLQLQLGHVDAAAAAIAAAEKVQASAGVVEEQAIHLSTVAAEVEAAQGRKPPAIARLTRAWKDADRLGLVTWSLEARLALSRLEPSEAAATERAAREAGFLLIARQARAAF
ncbi:MAG: winged helix-turn-helix domain-containing protein [Vicinamibacterales bacterium]